LSVGRFLLNRTKVQYARRSAFQTVSQSESNQPRATVMKTKSFSLSLLVSCGLTSPLVRAQSHYEKLADLPFKDGYIRLYGPKKAFFDKTCIPNDIDMQTRLHR
jgi:hypothetical protein